MPIQQVRQLAEHRPTPHPCPQVQPYAGGVAFLLVAAKGPTPWRWKCGKGEPGDVFPAKIILSSLPLLQAKVWTNVGALKK